MKKIIVLLVCCLVVGLMGCGSDVQGGNEADVNENEVIEFDADAEADAAQENEEADADNEEADDADEDAATDLITEEQALAAIKNYWFSEDPELEDMMNSGDYTIFFEVTTNDEGQIVVLYRSYTAAETRYYIDPETGRANITELVPGIMDEETASNELFNVRDYM